MPEGIDAYLRENKQDPRLKEPLMDFIHSGAVSAVTPDLARFLRIETLPHNDTAERVQAYLEHSNRYIAPLSPEHQEADIRGDHAAKDIEFIDGVRIAAHSVVRISTGFENGTGFLVAPGVMATARHTLYMGDNRILGMAVFMDENRQIPPNSPTYDLKMDADAFYFEAGSKDKKSLFDLVLIGVKGTSLEAQEALNEAPWLPLIRTVGKILTGHRVYVIHHPNGGRKNISLHGNRLTYLNDDPGFNDFCFYDADTRKGSSGAPVFNVFHQVIALHQGTVPAATADGLVQDKNGRLFGKERLKSELDEVKLIANRGLRTSRMVDLLERHDFDRPTHSEFRDKLIDLWQQPRCLELGAKVGWE
jgi:endonuclease G